VQLRLLPAAAALPQVKWSLARPLLGLEQLDESGFQTESFL